MKSLPLSVAREAEIEAMEAAQWYEGRSLGLGRVFLDLVEQTLAEIADGPLRFPEVYRGVRRALLKRFPFGVFFRVRRDQLRILAVMHLSRHPRRWRVRT